MNELLWSMLHRPYVPAFLLAFLVIGWLEQGKLRTLIWLVTGYLIAFTAEWGSINYGIPFGFYAYNEEALANDLLVAGVPFFDSLSFAFLSYFSFSMAQYFLSPLHGPGLNVQRVTLRRVRNSAAALFIGACLMVVIDVVTDPVTHHGRHWFLGDIYHYPVPGYYFDIPIANFAGWFVTGWLIILVNQRIDVWLARREARAGRAVILPGAPGKALLAPASWTSVVLFQLGVTAWLGWGYDLSGLPDDPASREAWQEGLRQQFITGCFVVAPLLMLAMAQLLRSGREPSPEMLEDWRAEYPASRSEILLSVSQESGDSLEFPTGPSDNPVVVTSGVTHTEAGDRT